MVHKDQGYMEMEDEDGIGEVKSEDNGKLSMLSRTRSANNLKASRLGGRSHMR